MALVDNLERRVARTIGDVKATIIEFVRRRLSALQTEDGVVADTTENAARVEAMLTELSAAINANGYQRVIDAQLAALQQLQADIIEQSDRLGLSTTVQRRTARLIETLRTNASDEIRRLANELIGRLSGLIGASVGIEEKDELIDAAFKYVDTTDHYVRTVSTTNLMAFNSLIRVAQAQDGGVQYFLYQGPKDDLTRPWCSHFVDRLVTAKILRDNQDRWGRGRQPKPVLAYRGGWNCRHRLVPVVDEDEIEEMIANGMLGPR